ncbi:MAG: hypothetical protein R2912_05930 [Eubacteriales bacterium]
MLYSIFPIPYGTVWILVSLFFSFILTFIAIKSGIDRLPKDQGRKYAINGELSKGKPRGAGSIFSL